MIVSADLVMVYEARLRMPVGSAWAGVRAQKQSPSLIVITDGFTADHNFTGVSAGRHRYRS